MNEHGKTNKTKLDTTRTHLICLPQHMSEIVTTIVHKSSRNDQQDTFRGFMDKAHANWTQQANTLNLTQHTDKLNLAQLHLTQFDTKQSTQLQRQHNESKVKDA